MYRYIKIYVQIYKYIQGERDIYVHCFGFPLNRYHEYRLPIEAFSIRKYPEKEIRYFFMDGQVGILLLSLSRFLHFRSSHVEYNSLYLRYSSVGWSVGLSVIFSKKERSIKFLGSYYWSICFCFSYYLFIDHFYLQEIFVNSFNLNYILTSQCPEEHQALRVL